MCVKCRRWNLSPLEERWEAIEACERAFSRTRLRVSTDNIALARASDGLDLVRVGTAKFSELAAWRYGKSLHQRWKTRGLPYAAAGLSGYALHLLFNIGVIGVAGFTGIMAAIILPTVAVTQRLGRARVILPDGKVVTLKHRKDNAIELEPDEEHGWALRLATGEQSVRATGTTATHGLRGVLTAANFFGGRPSQINEAIQRIGAVGDSHRFIERVASVASQHGAANVNHLPPEIRFALEMALHEDVERQAMEGELATLTEEWRLADEVAQIADNLLIGSDVVASLNRLKSGRPS